MPELDYDLFRRHKHDGIETDIIPVDLESDIVEGTLPIAKGGTGQTSKTPAFDALSPTTTKGDLIVSNGSDNIRIGVGVDGYVFTADSSDPAGIGWRPLTPVTCKAYRITTPFTFTNPDTDYTIDFNQDTTDGFGLHDNSTNPSRITIATAGTYFIHGVVYTTAGSTAAGADGNYRNAWIKLNGSSELARVYDDCIDGEDKTVQVSTIAILAANDYVQLMFRHGDNTGVTSDVGQEQTSLTVFRIT